MEYQEIVEITLNPFSIFMLASGVIIGVLKTESFTLNYMNILNGITNGIISGFFFYLAGISISLLFIKSKKTTADNSDFKTAPPKLKHS